MTSTTLRYALIGALLWPLPASAQDKWESVADVTLKAGTARNLGSLNLMMPVMQNEDSMVFVDLRTVLTDQDSWEGNMGLGLRRRLDQAAVIVGGYGFLDTRRSEYDNTFHQATIGIEAIGEEWDGRLNIYRPLGDSRHTATTGTAGATLSGNSIIFDTGTTYEQAAAGYDLEIGHAVPYIPRTLSYIARYDFNVDGGPDITGYRARLASDIHDRVRIGLEYQFADSVRDNELSASIRLRIPFNGSRPSDAPRARLDDRMTEPVVRDIDIVTARAAPAPQVAMKADGSGPLKVLFVENTAAAGGDGTAQRPYNTLAAAQGVATAYDTIYVLPGDGTTAGMANGIALAHNGQRLIGAGTALTLRTAGTSMPQTLDGRILRTAATAPVITNATGHGITITASDIELAGLRIDNAAGDGVHIASTAAAATALNTRLHELTVQNSGGHGIYLHAAAGGSASAALNRSILRNNTGHGIVIYDDTDAAFSADLGGGALGATGLNAIYNNGREDIAIELDGGTLSARNNYWGQPGGISSSQIFYGAPIGDTLVAHWRFDGDSGDRIAGHNGTLQNGATLNASGHHGSTYQGAQAASQHVNIGDFAAADNGDKLTVSYWINPDTLAPTATHIEKWDENNVVTNNSWGIRTTNADGTQLFAFIADSIDGGDNYFATTDANLTAGTWQLITMVYDGAGATNVDRLKMYKNGILLNGNYTGTIPVTLHNTGESIGIGRALINDPAFAQYFDGRIDDMRIYNSALGANTVRELYRMNGGSTIDASSFLSIAP